MTKFNGKLGINDFVRRQTADSEFSHYTGSFEDLLFLALTHWPTEDTAPAVLVTVPINGDFFCGVVKVDKHTLLDSTFGSREGSDPDEEPDLSWVALGAEKILGVEATLVFCTHAALAAKNENTFDDIEFELVSINVEEVKGKRAPMHPRTMARNHLDKPGGTKNEYTGDQFAESIDYWKDRVMNGGQL